MHYNLLKVTLLVKDKDRLSQSSFRVHALNSHSALIPLFNKRWDLCCIIWVVQEFK